MKDLLTKLRGLFSREPAHGLTQAQEGALSNSFKARYHNFKLLLAANNKALELMSEMEGALAGDRVFGASFVRARCTSLGVNVYLMVKNLDSLAPGRYQALSENFKSIQSRIEQAVRGAPPQANGELVVPLDGVDKFGVDQVGGKMANLGEIANRLNLTTPPGFAITAAGYARFFAHNGLQEEINRRVQSTVMGRTDQLFGLSSDLQQLIANAEVPEDLAQAITSAYQRLEEQSGPGITVSTRSSAVGEDAAQASFAGQYASQLNVNARHLLVSYKEVVASKYSPQAMHYRYVRGLRDEDLPMCVGCLAMVNARAGGVAYSCSPLDPRDDRVRVTSTWGLPKGVVDGDAPTDLFVVAREEPPRMDEQSIAHKDTRFDCFPDEGVCRLTSSGVEADLPSLNQEQALEVARLALLLEAHYGSPQDVEWALDGEGRVVILQCRPLLRVDQSAPAAEVKGHGAELVASGGVTASPGAASGKVFWVRKDSDALRFPPGAVLATSWPAPRWAALMDKAAAILAQRGSPAGHLATVAREYRVPAIFSLGEALVDLADGSEVTVHADGRAIYAGRVEPLIATRQSRAGLMENSPVMNMLQSVLKLITPLNLLDPDAPDFRAEKTATLHDITRFCHEKAVHEMFAFGKEHHFPQRSSKQLYYKVPMQWWVLNLDDGFVQEVSGKYVRLEDIACQPMLALWDGMVAVPWQGPPAASGRGMASVLFEATANPSLTPGIKTRYANRNYFMVARHFLNLQSRFGFHFSTVEAMAGPRQRENYVSFNFKGGAADMSRRVARVQYLAKVLDEVGFRTRINADSLNARLEGQAEPEALLTLKVLGYLIMHTRQLDMIMGDPARAAHYFQKLSRQAKALRTGE